MNLFDQVAYVGRDYEAEKAQVEREIEQLEARRQALEEAHVKQQSQPKKRRRRRTEKARQPFNGQIEQLLMNASFVDYAQGQMVSDTVNGCMQDFAFEQYWELYMGQTIKLRMHDTEALYSQLPNEIIARPDNIRSKCLLDAWICWVGSGANGQITTAGVLNQLAYMGDIGRHLCQEIFGRDIADLMRGNDNKQRKEALNLILQRVKGFVQCGLLHPLPTKQQIVPNAPQTKEKVCNAWVFDNDNTVSQ